MKAKIYCYYFDNLGIKIQDAKLVNGLVQVLIDGTWIKTSKPLSFFARSSKIMA